MLSGKLYFSDRNGIVHSGFSGRTIPDAEYRQIECSVGTGKVTGHSVQNSFAVTCVTVMGHFGIWSYPSSVQPPLTGSKAEAWSE